MLNWRLGILLVFLTFSLAVLAFYPSFTIDDAYILFRYADNLASYGELTWNVGEDPVEGYTGIALPLLIAGAIKLGISPLLASKAIGILSFLAGGVLMDRFLGLLDSRPAIRIGILALYFGAPFLYTAAIGGLETTIFSTFVLLSIYLLYRYLRARPPSTGRETGLLVAILICGLLRPEGVVLAALTIVALLVAQLRRDPSQTASLVLRITLLFGIPAVAYFLWRWNYYGHLLPMTFYAKSFEGFFNVYSRWELQRFVEAYLLIPIAVSAGVIVMRWRSIRAALLSPRERETSAFCITYSVAVGFSLVVIGKYMDSHLLMNVQHRFFAPFFALALLGIAWILNVSLTREPGADTQRPLRWGLAVFMIVAGLAFQFFSYAREFREQFQYTGWYGRLLNDENIAAGKWLRNNVAAEEWLIVVSDAGAVPYYSRLRTVDFGGLNDEKLNDLNTEEQIDYFFSIKPGAVVMTSNEWDNARHEFSPRTEQLATDPRFDRYHLIKRYKSDSRDGHYQFLYLRDDLAGGNLTRCP